jgi:hypothetical protein
MGNNRTLPLSPIFIDFLNNIDVEKEFLEGTTASGKTTIGLGLKFMFMVARSNKRDHLIAAKSIGKIEKDLISQTRGLKDIWGNNIEYKKNGSKDSRQSHILFHTPNGDKRIYLAGYNNQNSMENAVGSQFGCVYLDEINLSSFYFVQTVGMRCDYMLGTLNPDNPDIEIYKDYINKCYPKEKYKDRVPTSILQELDTSEHYPKWDYWFFTFKDNLSLSEDDINRRIRGAGSGREYQQKILGLRTKGEGIIFEFFERKKHLIRYKEAKEKEFILFSSGLDVSYSSKTDDVTAMVYVGLTKDREVILLDEKIMNNKGRSKNEQFTATDVAKEYVKFLDKNCKEWGKCINVFCECADSNTIGELNKYKLTHGGVFYKFIPCHKIPIMERISNLDNWMKHGYYYVLDHCLEHIKEIENYSWKEGNKENVPEDKWNHTIDSFFYATIPYFTKIGIEK